MSPVMYRNEKERSVCVCGGGKLPHIQPKSGLVLSRSSPVYIGRGMFFTVMAVRYIGTVGVELIMYLS